MYDIAQDLLDSFRATPAILRGLLHACTDEQARAARGGDEGWSVIEVICHLRDAEERAHQRTRQMRDHANPLIEGYDQEELARAGSYAAAELRPALDGFLAARAAHLADLAALTAEQWQRPGTHSEIGPITIASHAAHLASHDAVHCAQIAHQLGRAG